MLIKLLVFSLLLFSNTVFAQNKQNPSTSTTEACEDVSILFEELVERLIQNGELTEELLKGQNKDDDHFPWLTDGLYRTHGMDIAALLSRNVDQNGTVQTHIKLYLTCENIEVSLERPEDIRLILELLKKPYFVRQQAQQ